MTAARRKASVLANRKASKKPPSLRVVSRTTPVSKTRKRPAVRLPATGGALPALSWFRREPPDTTMPALPLVCVSFKDRDHAFTVMVSFGGAVRVN